MVRLDPPQGSWAVSFARNVVESVVRDGDPPPVPEDVDDVFQIERGAFVTLRKQGELRGCIGRPHPRQTAVEAIREAAIGAATEDPRFPPVNESELEDSTVEVSVLTPFEPIDVDDPAEYRHEIRIGRDGLVVSKGQHRGLLLPQVPLGRDWDVEKFLRHTCRKANLPRNAWQDADVTVERFGAQVFEEQEPRGDVEEVELAEE